MSIGRISGYVPPDATEAGIMPMDASGAISGGGYWILWDNTAGYIGHGWFWTDPNNYLAAGWQYAVTNNKTDCHTTHDTTKTGFTDHMTTCNPEDLDEILGGWSNSQKWAFLQSHSTVFKNCTESS